MLHNFIIFLALSTNWGCLVEAQCEDRASFRTPREDCGYMGGVNYVAGGRNAAREELPWQAGVYSKRTRPYMQICGGTLVSAKVVITAAHCFWNDVQKLLPAENYAVAVNKLYRPWNDPQDMEYAQRSDVLEIRVPPRYQGSSTNFQDDLALLVVATPFQLNQKVRPVCLDFDYELDSRQLASGNLGKVLEVRVLPRYQGSSTNFQLNRKVRPVCLDFDHELDSRQLTPGNLGKVAGWGRTDENGAPSPTLQVLYMPAVDIQECIAKVDPGFLPAITSDKICAGYTDAGTAVCMGDSGGGLSFYDSRSYRHYLRGVVSTAPKSESLCNIYTYATFTHINKHEHFIRSVMTETAETTARVPSSRTSTIIFPGAPSNQQPLAFPPNRTSQNSTNSIEFKSVAPYEHGVSERQFMTPGEYISMNAENRFSSIKRPESIGYPSFTAGSQSDLSSESRENLNPINPQ